MEELEIKVIENTLTVADGNGKRTIALPLDLAQQVDPDQWLNNFRRQLRYACANVGWEVGPEQQAEIVKQIITTETVRQRIENGDNAFWRGRLSNERQEWFYVNEFQERPIAPPGGPAEQVGVSPGPPPEDDTTKRNLLVVFALISILVASFYFWPKEDEPVEIPSSDEIEDLFEGAASLLNGCLSVEGKPGETLENSMAKDTFSMIDYPFRRLLKKVVERDGLEDREAIRKAALEIINKRTERWENRCNCKLINSCIPKN